MLALSYHFGSGSAGAQAGTAISGCTAISGDGNFHVMTPNGDIYARGFSGTAMYPDFFAVGNFWAGGPTPTQRETWGQLKQRYALDRGAVRPHAVKTK